MKTLVAAILLSAIQAMAADIYDFSVLPAGGAVQGAPGSTVGWGYSIRNESTSLWLVTTRINTGVFQQGTPIVLFDFPAIAPGNTVTLPFNAVAGTGLAELMWDISAPVGFSETGNFVLGADWWSGDPLANGRLQFAAPDASQAYRATVASAAPEPTTFALFAIALLAVGFARRIKTSHPHNLR